MQPSNSTEETLMLPRLPALTLRLAWMSSPLPPHPPLHPHASGLRTRTAPSLSSYRRELLSPAPSSRRTSPKPSSSPSQPITARTAFANYVKDSLLTMSKARYKKAMSTINRLLSPQQTQQQQHQRTTTPTPTPVYAALGSAAQVLRDSPVQPSPVQAQPLSTASSTFPLRPTSQNLVPSWDLLISVIRMGNSTHPQPGKKYWLFSDCCCSDCVVWLWLLCTIITIITMWSYEYKLFKLTCGVLHTFIIHQIICNL